MVRKDAIFCLFDQITKRGLDKTPVRPMYVCNTNKKKLPMIFIKKENNQNFKSKKNIFLHSTHSNIMCMSI